MLVPMALQQPVVRPAACVQPAWRVPYKVKVAFFWLSCVLVAALAGHHTHKRLFLGRLHVQALLRPTVFRHTKAPHVTAQVQNTGQQMALAPADGKWALVHFWATWCQTCRAEMATLRGLSERLGGQLQVLTVAVDTNWEDIAGFFAAQHSQADSHEPHFALLWDPQRQAADRYGVKRFPESFLLSPSGFVRVGFVGARDWSGRVAVNYLHDIMASRRSPQG